MNDIEKKAAAMMDALYSELVWPDVQRYPARRVFPPFEALCRAIEQHEAFRQEVSYAAVEYNEHGAQSGWLGFDHFIISKPDPLIEAMHDCGVDRFESWADQLREAIAKRGGKIVWEG